MRKPIFLKIFTGYLLIAIAITGITTAVSFKIIRSFYIDTTARNLENLSVPIMLTISPLWDRGRFSEMEDLVKRLESPIQARITVLNTEGIVLADSEKDPKTLESHLSRPEVASAIQGKIGRSIRYSTTIKKDMLYVALPVQQDGMTKGVIRLSVPLHDIDVMLAEIQDHILKVFFAVIVISLFVALIFTHILASPIRKMKEASKKVAQGNFKEKVAIKGNDELSDLAKSFNEMTIQLEASFSEISKNKEELESIVSSISEGLFLLDKQGRIILFNNSAKKITKTDAIAKKYYWEVLRSHKITEILSEKEKDNVVEEITLDDKVYLCSITPLTGGRTILLLHDITEMKKMEDLKRDLVANVSHELRTPLTAIMGFTETLLEDADDKNKEYLSIIKRHTDRLINLIQDLLNLSELEEKGFRIIIEQVDVKSLIENIMTIFEPKVREKGLDFSINASGPMLINADPFRLEQLFTNLIDNAIKYTEKGKISVNMEMRQEKAVIKVQDTGIGISKDNLSRIFERFYVVDKSRSRSLGGTGLGLAIAKHVVSLHEGILEVESTPYMGTTFIVTLPVKAKT
jgi:two-component system phosphate regulon sensor histidine kinase PhoR